MWRHGTNHEFKKKRYDTLAWIHLFSVPKHRTTRFRLVHHNVILGTTTILKHSHTVKCKTSRYIEPFTHGSLVCRMDGLCRMTPVIKVIFWFSKLSVDNSKNSTQAKNQVDHKVIRWHSIHLNYGGKLRAWHRLYQVFIRRWKRGDILQISREISQSLSWMCYIIVCRA